MAISASWRKERTLGIMGLAGLASGWMMLLYVQTFTSVCGPSVRTLSRAILLISLASPVAVLWAALKEKWWWVIGLIPALLLLWSAMGTFADC
jgi:hypothetical protein